MSVVWSSDDLQWLEAQLIRVNGRREARTLDATTVRKLVDDFVANDAPFLVKHGGDVEDVRKHTTMCLVVKVQGAVVLGLAAARTGPATPDRAFADLRSWDRWLLPSNLSRVERWAEHRADDRRRLSIELPKGHLIDAVLAAPDDDGPRLVLADVLMEQGDPRGEFIAAQCAFERTGDEAHERRANELLSRNERTWLGPLVNQPGVELRRGFIEAITVVDPAIIHSALHVLAREPVRRVVVSGRQRVEASQLLQWPFWNTVRALALRSNESTILAVDDFGALLESRRLRGVEELALVGQLVRDAGLRALAESEAFPALTSLSLSADTITVEGIAALAKARWFSKLTRLELVHDRLGDDAVAALAKTRAKSLRSLSLSSNLIGDAGAKALAASTAFPKLERLWLTSNRIGPAGGAALVSSKRLGQAQLGLEANPIGGALERQLLLRSPNQAG